MTPAKDDEARSAGRGELALGSIVLLIALGIAVFLFRSASAPKPAPKPPGEPPRTTIQDGMLVLRHDTFLDHAWGSWIGKVVGVSWGKEIGYENQVFAESDVPRWTPALVAGALGADDLYVAVPYLRALETGGAHCSWAALGRSFGAFTGTVAHGNQGGLDRLKAGLLPPESGRNAHAGDNDWQSVADFVGVICLGRPAAAVDLAWRAGHVTNWGDGAYAGVFVAAMIAGAPTATASADLVEAGRRALPEQSSYRRMVSEIQELRKELPQDWEEAWRRFRKTWTGARDCRYRAEIQGACVCLALLYGQGDFERSLRIALRLGQGACCNAGTVGAVLGAWLGRSKLPARFAGSVDDGAKIRPGGMTVGDAVRLCERLARESLPMAGGTIAEGAWRIPQPAVLPPVFEVCDLRQPPLPAPEASVAGGEGRTVRFRAAPAEGVSFRWHFGDLSMAEGREATRTYAVPGTYHAVFYAADASGRTGWKEIVVEVK